MRACVLFFLHSVESNCSHPSRPVKVHSEISISTIEIGVAKIRFFFSNKEQIPTLVHKGLVQRLALLVRNVIHM